MKSKLFYIFSISILTSCSTYNYQSNKQDIAIYKLKTEPKEALFTESKFTKGSHTLKFYIHDLDDSTFKCNNVQIYDSTIEGKLEPVKGKIVFNELSKKNIHSRNEVHIDIDRQCTNKNTKIYLEPNDIDTFQHYKISEEVRDRNKNQLKKAIKIYLWISLIGALLGLVSGSIISIIFG